MHGRVKCINPEGENGVGYRHQPQNNFGRPRTPGPITSNLIPQEFISLVDVTVQSLYERKSLLWIEGEPTDLS